MNILNLLKFKEEEKKLFRLSIAKNIIFVHIDTYRFHTILYALITLFNINICFAKKIKEESKEHQLYDRIQLKCYKMLLFCVNPVVVHNSFLIYSKPITIIYTIYYEINIQQFTSRILFTSNTDMFKLGHFTTIYEALLHE